MMISNNRRVLAQLYQRLTTRNNTMMMMSTRTFSTHPLHLHHESLVLRSQQQQPQQHPHTYIQAPPSQQPGSFWISNQQQQELSEDPHHHLIQPSPPLFKDNPSLLKLLKWGDDYLSTHLNSHVTDDEALSSSPPDYAPFSDYYEESLQLLAHTLHLDYQSAKQRVYLTSSSSISQQHQQYISQEQYETFIQLIRERAENNVPLQYLIGSCNFYGRDFLVNQSVLIPRADSEILIDATLHQIHHHMKDSVLRILDIGTGSGCLVTSLLCELFKDREHHTATAIALDNSYDALHVARKNATRLLPNTHTNALFFVHQDILKNKDPVESLGSFNVIISNPPYIKTSVIPQLAPEVREYEPIGALDGGEDGLVFYRHLIKICDQTCILDEGGILTLEIGYDQSNDVQQMIFSSQNLVLLSVNKDLSGIDRAIVAMKQSIE